jgi:hypothetical protein
VNDLGQLFTIEGVAAAILMVVTAYLAVSTTMVLTPQDVHIVDMQLQVLGNDALAMMDTPDSFGIESDLAQYIRTNDADGFNEAFINLVNSNTSVGRPDNLKMEARVYCRDTNDLIQWIPFSGTPPETYYRENAVKVSRWVYLSNGVNNVPQSLAVYGLDDGLPHTVLLEVLLWRS